MYLAEPQRKIHPVNSELRAGKQLLTGQENVLLLKPKKSFSLCSPRLCVRHDFRLLLFSLAWGLCVRAGMTVWVLFRETINFEKPQIILTEIQHIIKDKILYFYLLFHHLKIHPRYSYLLLLLQSSFSQFLLQRNYQD